MVASMRTLHLVPADLQERYHVKEGRNATGVLASAHPQEWQDIQEVLRQFKLLASEIRVGGGNRSLISRRIDEPLYARGWVEKNFKTSIIVDDAKIDSPTHSVDCFKGGVAVEMEWNNKDPFFDRDLNNFRLLFELRAIEVGIIVTRAWPRLWPRRSTKWAREQSRLLPPVPHRQARRPPRPQISRRHGPVGQGPDGVRCKRGFQGKRANLSVAWR